MDSSGVFESSTLFEGAVRNIYSADNQSVLVEHHLSGTKRRFLKLDASGLSVVVSELYSPFFGKYQFLDNGEYIVVATYLSANGMGHSQLEHRSNHWMLLDSKLLSNGGGQWIQSEGGIAFYDGKSYVSVQYTDGDTSKSDFVVLDEDLDTVCIQPIPTTSAIKVFSDKTVFAELKWYQNPMRQLLLADFDCSNPSFCDHTSTLVKMIKREKTSIYPNPNSGNEIFLSNHEVIENVALHRADGVFLGKILLENGHLRFDEPLSPGVYCLQILMKNGDMVFRKMIVE